MALLRVLAKHGKRYEDRPSPIFLIGEIESFLHPYAQKQLAVILNTLAQQYQILTTTHSPFIINPECISGYRKVVKGEEGTISQSPNIGELDLSLFKRHLSMRGNLEGLFADRVVLLEGSNDEYAFDKICKILNIHLPDKKFVLFVRADGKQSLRVARKFYNQLNFEDVSIIADLDYLFCNEFRNILKEIGEDEEILGNFRNHIEYKEDGDPSLKQVLSKIEDNGEPDGFDRLLRKLQEERIFVLRHGAPEMYYRNNRGQKNGWTTLNSEEDLLDPDYLREFFTQVLY